MTLEQLLQGSVIRTPKRVSTNRRNVAGNEPMLRRMRDASHGQRGRSSEWPRRHAAFVDGFFGDASPLRAYRLYEPAIARGGDRSLIVMLHGAGQDHLDFARGVAMHDHPSAVDTFVLYPGQATHVPARCWNWFREADQSRGDGEPALLAALTRSVVARHDISPRRIYVAGLSAGGAMALVLASAYPDLFAAVGVHSGLPYRAASDMYGALELMARGPSSLARPRGAVVPTIVLHGDRDTTVHPANASAIVADAIEGCTRQAIAPPLTDDARPFTLERHADAKGVVRVEHWTLHGIGHAWSGGSAEGSHTTGDGPDATGAMLRFFQSHRLEPRRAR